MSRTAACIGFRGACEARSARNAALPRSSSGVTQRRARAVATITGSQRGEHALAVGLAERNEPHAGRDEVGGEARADRRAAPAPARTPMAPRRRRRPRPAGDGAVPQRRAADRAPAHGQAARVAARKARPCAVGLEVPLRRRREGGGQLGDRAQRRIVVAAGRAMGVGEQDRVAAARRRRRASRSSQRAQRRRVVTSRPPRPPIRARCE